MVWTGQSIYLWHVNNLIAPNEKLSEPQKKRMGYFVLHDQSWWLVNEGMSDLMDVSTKTVIPIGGQLELKDGQQILLAKGDGGRLAMVQMVESAPG
jgi:hypothetical protein